MLVKIKTIYLIIISLVPLTCLPFTKLGADFIRYQVVFEEAPNFFELLKDFSLLKFEPIFYTFITIVKSFTNTSYGPFIATGILSSIFSILLGWKYRNTIYSKNIHLLFYLLFIYPIIIQFPRFGIIVTSAPFLFLHIYFGNYKFSLFIILLLALIHKSGTLLIPMILTTILIRNFYKIKVSFFRIFNKFKIFKINVKSILLIFVATFLSVIAISVLLNSNIPLTIFHYKTIDSNDITNSSYLIFFIKFFLLCFTLILIICSDYRFYGSISSFLAALLLISFVEILTIYKIFGLTSVGRIPILYSSLLFGYLFIQKPKLQNPFLKANILSFFIVLQPALTVISQFI